LQYGLYALQAIGAEFGNMVDVLAFPDALNAESFESSIDLAERIVGLVELEAYDAVGLSTIGNSFHHSINIARRIKKQAPRIEIWMGGPHASILHNEVLNSLPEVDAVFIGEADFTFRDVLQARLSGSERLAGIPGVQVRSAPFEPRPAIEDLDSLPFIDAAKDFPFTSGFAYKFPNTIPLEGSRGCPGRCTYCSTRLFWGGLVHRKSDARLIAEMLRLEERTHLAEFMLIGDNFASPREKFLGFCKAVRREAGHLKWNCNVKMDQLRSEDLAVMWDGGCRGIFVGVESASQSTLARVRKGLSLKRELELIAEAIDKGFRVETSLIIGFPWEAPADIDKTYELHCELLRRGVWRSMVWVLCPLPGTDLVTIGEPKIQFDHLRSRIAMDGVGEDPQTLEMIDQYPKLFTQFGYFENPHTDRNNIDATADAAFQLSNYYFAQGQAG
jgi:radical SAM superfamily enzyme YgiQ (UPF0313 family)